MTATRADYPRVKSVLREIVARPSLELQLLVTGMHLAPEFGRTVDEIVGDGFPIASEVPMYDSDDSPYGMAKAAARCALGMADALHKLRPDLVLLTVDRVETLATAQTAAFMNLPIAHIQGGEVTGTIDESIRHAVTKLSHIHFAATDDAAERILKMGEDPTHVHNVGCPYLDIIRTLDYEPKARLAELFGFDPAKPLVLFTQHPVTTEYGQGYHQLRATLDALAQFPEVEIVAIYCNADAGGREIIREMQQDRRFHLHPNIPDRLFLSLMRCADVMVGNSSAGIREAPSFGLPVVNIGTRQSGRRRAGNVLDVPHDPAAIAAALRRALENLAFREQLRHIPNPYGDGYSAKRIVDILERVELGPRLLQKKITY